MSLSKPIYSLLGSYFEQLYNNPVRTKAITCCIIATAGNLTSQYLSGAKFLDKNSLIAYSVFGLLFGGTLPHYFYGFLERAIDDEARLSAVKKIFFERLMYLPLYQAFTLYMIARLEGKTHDAALKQLQQLFWPVLSSNWKYLTIVQIINFSVVPPMLRVFITNLIGFFWTVYISNKRRQNQAKAKSN